MGAKVTNNGENAYFYKSHPDKLENGTGAVKWRKIVLPSFYLPYLFLN
jgi:hypothetical protein